jgi:hypothetical protein
MTVRIGGPMRMIVRVIMAMVVCVRMTVVVRVHMFMIMVMVIPLFVAMFVAMIVPMLVTGVAVIVIHRLHARCNGHRRHRLRIELPAEQQHQQRPAQRE